ncbi:MAG: glycoside hydrolase family 2 TIM barrel-domain containing protein [Tepidisphaeraceae bacterium]
MAVAGIGQAVDLAGEWRVWLERDGIQAWCGACRLPGSIQEQGIGDDVTADTPWIADLNGARDWYTSARYASYREPRNIKLPYFLQPKKHFVGVAWFEREIEIPKTWQGGRALLHLERPHWQTRCWIDGVEVGESMDSLSTPHERLLPALTPSRHTLRLRVDNRMIHPVGPNSHSVSDHTQGAWNGIVGRIELQWRPGPTIDRVQINTRPGERSVEVTIDGTDLASATIELDIEGVTKASVQASDAPSVHHTIVLDEPLPTWDEFSPRVHHLVVRLRSTDGQIVDQRRIAFGARSIGTRGTQILVNGRPTFLRGTLDCCIFPRTGYPPTNVDEWRHVMGIVKAYGLNHVRFHSYCPPEAAFDAADELGVYLQVECASWANQGATVGDGSSLDAWLYAEAERIIAAYGNHPSFVMLAYGNEPAGARHVKYLTKWVEHWKQHDPSRLHTTGAGWTAVPQSDFHSIWEPRIQHWGAGLTSRINGRDPETMTDYREHVAKHAGPIVTHEIGQWCVFPMLREIDKAAGVNRATNIEIVRDSLEASGLLALADDFVHASGKLQTLCYKEEIESQLRTPGLGGFQLLGLQDFPGQGMAVVGVVDPYWDAKPYVSADEFRRFCNATVILARLPQRAWTNDQTLTADLEIAHYGQATIKPAVVDWRVEGGSQIVAHGTLTRDRIDPGELASIGRIRVPLALVAEASSFRLVAELRDGSSANDWNLWVYPAKNVSVDEDVIVCDALDDRFRAAVEGGKPVLLSLGGHDPNAEVALGFSSIFWNTLFTRGQAPHTLGILCDPAHPSLAGFPTESHSDWQWSEPIRHARCLMLDRVRHARLDPIVRVIDDWNTNRSLGLLVEVTVGRSRVIVSGIDLAGDLSARPVSRQLRASLLNDLATSTRDSSPLTIDELAVLTRRHETVLADASAGTGTYAAGELK